MQAAAPGGPNVLSLAYHGGSGATVIASKSGGRYRIQAVDFPSLNLLAVELTRRLKELYSVKSDTQPRGVGAPPGPAVMNLPVEEGDEPFRMTHSDDLPLADFFGAIDQHFQCRQRHRDAHAELERRTHQHRVIQKRLLLRYKDKNPSPLNQLDQLLADTHMEVIDMANAAELAWAQLVTAGNILSNATSLVLLLIQLRFGLTDKEGRLLASHLSPIVADSAQPTSTYAEAQAAGGAVPAGASGWEETTAAGMTHLLKTVLAKSSKETATMPPPLGMPDDTSKLKRYISIVCDRLAKVRVCCQC